jgi:hypothetical protein
MDKISTMPRASGGGSRIDKKEGIDELLQCLNPSTFDFPCIVKNLDWFFNNTLNSIYLQCALGTATPDPADPARKVSSGPCSSWFGLPGLAQPQKCINFDAAARASTACTTKCAADGLSYEASGCDGSTIFCWCRE